FYIANSCFGGLVLWVCPFLAIHQLSAEIRQKQLVLGFSMIFILFHLIQSSGVYIPYFNLSYSEPLSQLYNISQKDISIILTLLVATGGIICFRIAMNGVLSNDFFRLSRKPLFIGISGDSGSGKDTLAQSLIELLGRESVAHISGDDYHNWDRNRPMWQVLTHLNPEANDLEKYKQDCLSLFSGRSVRSRHYDHNSGKMTKPIMVKHNDIVITSGLHALYSNSLLEKYDVKIFLDMDEDLRRYLKINRDVLKRGHSLEKVMASINARENDRNKYILPQKNNTDMVIKILPSKPLDLSDACSKEVPQNFKLEVVLNNFTSVDNIIKTLISYAGLEVDVEEVGGKKKIIINDTKITSEDVAACIKKLIPKIDDLISVQPVWSSNATGLIHIFILNQIVNSLRKRLV
ncbi:MAG TPA: uridine kinase, partial [Alphaproteobacteria bacterium]|nr:uridine kinase [Alphaproteobacteria bacterium]